MEAGSDRAIAFVGFMGAGKSEAARAAAAALGEEAVDADEAIEAEIGEPIASFFEREGEAAFREREERLVGELLARGGVVSLGGGAIESERIRAALAEQVAVWCRVTEETAWERSHGTGRPLAVERPEFARRFTEREPLYEAAADVVLPEGGADLGRLSAPWLAALRGALGVRIAWAHSASGDYPAAVGAGALGLLADERVRAGATEPHPARPGDGAGERAGAPIPRRLFAVADREAVRHHRDLLPRSEAVVEVEGSEASKTLEEAGRVLRELALAGARRDDGVLAFGGGVVGDLGGFCAASYQRGIPLVQVPTTLLAQVDSAYGGKTAVDLPEAKNYVGAYHLPSAVLADPRPLATLAPEELAAGFAEVLKTALIAGGTLWDRVRALDSLDPTGLDDVIFDCARTKLEVVATDERDAGRRAVLNLGHTVGHAIEAATGYSRLRHGEAVGLGILAALRLSEAEELRAETAAILARHGLPTALAADVDTDAVLAAVERDKKRTADGVGFVLLERPGEPLEGRRVGADSVRAAVDELRGG